ncbi:MAG: Crp/Fnr family transcriptional regulator [Candidatus Acidiferrales bacterium]
MTITTTAFKSDLIDPAIGMKLFTSQSNTPTTTSTISICSNGISFYPFLFAGRHSGPSQVVAPIVWLELRPLAGNSSERGPAISGVMQVKACWTLRSPRSACVTRISILQYANRGVCSLVHTTHNLLLPFWADGTMAWGGGIESVAHKTAKRASGGRPEPFNAQKFLDSAGVARKVAQFSKQQSVFSQGDACKDVFYIQTGGVRLSVVNETGREAVVAVLSPGDFFGEGCLAGQAVRIGTATAIAPTTALVIEKKEMIRVLHHEHEFSDRFISYMLSRNIRIEEDLIDQLFNSSEKRLARTLLLLARYGQEDRPQGVLPKMSQETLAEMVGTTRSRVNFFMNKFRKLGFIKYNGALQINTSLLSVVLHD